MAKETVIVFKDNKSREIHTYVSLEGHGARMDVKDFISLVSELYGSPAFTFSKQGLLEGLLEASDQAIFQMKSQTREVAAINLEPKMP
jgi:hypothetical protein